MKTSRSLCFFWGPELDLQLYVRSCGNFVLVEPDKEIFQRMNFGEIFWPVSGQCYFHWENSRQILQPGKIWYYPPGSFHEYHPVGTFHYCWLTIAGRYARDFFSMLNVSPGLNPSGLCPESLFDILGKQLQHHTRQSQMEALNTAFQITTRISLPSGKKQLDLQPLQEARKYINTNFSNKELTVSQIADSIHMHRGSFSRSFHREYNITAAEYITYVRIRNAISLLRDTHFCIREIAELCGFSSANYFTKVFIRQIGTTPRQYRTKKISQTDNIPSKDTDDSIS